MRLDDIASMLMLACSSMAAIWVFGDSHRRGTDATWYRSIASMTLVAAASGALLGMGRGALESAAAARHVMVVIGLAAGVIALMNLIAYVHTVRQSDWGQLSLCPLCLNPVHPVAGYCLACARGAPAAVANPQAASAHAAQVPRAPAPASAPPPPSPGLLDPTQALDSALLARPIAWLVCMDDHNVGETHVLGEVADVGRNRRLCSVVATHPSVSDQHARIRRDGERFVVEDLGSANLTRVNGHTTNWHVLEDGDWLEFGSASYAFLQVMSGGVATRQQPATAAGG